MVQFSNSQQIRCLRGEKAIQQPPSCRKTFEKPTTLQIENPPGNPVAVLMAVRFKLLLQPNARTGVTAC
jgi:hypothetical protein